jgi:hypothetical protein
LVSFAYLYNLVHVSSHMNSGAHLQALHLLQARIPTLNMVLMIIKVLEWLPLD